MKVVQGDEAYKLSQTRPQGYWSPVFRPVPVLPARVARAFR